MVTAELGTEGVTSHVVPLPSREHPLFKFLAQNSCLVWVGSQVEPREDRCRHRSHSKLH